LRLRQWLGVAVRGHGEIPVRAAVVVPVAGVVVEAAVQIRRGGRYGHGALPQFDAELNVIAASGEMTGFQLFQPR